MQWVAVNSSEWIGKEGESCGGGACFYSLGLDDDDERVKCLCVAVKDNANKADI